MKTTTPWWLAAAALLLAGCDAGGPESEQTPESAPAGNGDRGAAAEQLDIGDAAMEQTGDDPYRWLE